MSEGGPTWTHELLTPRFLVWCSRLLGSLGEHLNTLHISSVGILQISLNNASIGNSP
jgi:hypothetical protein